jgi:hypothetical protein
MTYKEPWNQLPWVTTDRGITANQTYAAVMARSGDDLASGDGLGAFGVTLILPVQMHLRSGRAAASTRIQGGPAHPHRPQLSDSQLAIFAAGLGLPA